MRVLSIFALIVIFATILCGAFTEATRTMLGIAPGCIFTKTLKPYKSYNYTPSAVILNTIQDTYNWPALLYNGPGMYAFIIPFDTAGAGVIGQLADNTNLEGLQNINAVNSATNFQRYQGNTQVGATYYGFGSLEMMGAVQFAYQVKAADPVSGEITVDFGAFVINSAANDGSNCWFTQRASTLSRSCSGKFEPTSIACGN